MSKKERIGNYLFNCLTKEQKKALLGIWDDNNMQLNNPPVIVVKKPIYGRRYKDCFTVEIKLVPGAMG